MHKVLVMLAPALLLVGCSSKTDPSESNFNKAISAYLEKKGQLCVARERWPVDLTAGEIRNELPQYPGQPSRMAALERAGLVASSQQEVPVKNWFGKSDGKQTVTRYVLTEKGKSFFKPNESRGDDSQVSGELCYGRKAVDKIVKWDEPISFQGYQETSVKYQYRIEDLAGWAKDEKLQALYPAIKSSIEHAGSELQSHGVHLTNLGWEANGIDN